MKKKKKNVKGMTLIEVIISMLVFTIMATVMVRTGQVTKSLMMNTNHVTNKTTAEAPIGSVQDVDALRDSASNLTDAGGDPYDAADIAAELNETPVIITVTSGSFVETVNAKKYSTSAAAKEATNNGRNSDTSNHLNGDLEFYVIETQPVAPGP